MRAGGDRCPSRASRGAYRLGAPSQQHPGAGDGAGDSRCAHRPASAEDKRLLQTAAVIGKDVPYALLRAIAELPEEDLRHGLSALQAAEFVYETSLFPDLEYTFKHALTHEVAYGGLLQERRRELHARIVQDSRGSTPIDWRSRRSDSRITPSSRTLGEGAYIPPPCGA